MNKNAMSLLLAAGMVTPALATDTAPMMAPKGAVSSAQLMGHIYVNVATGEKIATALTDGLRPAGARGLPPEVWMADNGTPCASVTSSAPYTANFVGAHDDPADVGGSFDAIAYGAAYMNWGDVASDTVIDTIQVSTYAGHPDVDDGSGMGSGVEGLACTWQFFEGDNGFNSCFRMGLIGLTLTSIPGNIGLFAIEGYIYTLDLAGDFTESISFEIGDTDGDSQGAAVNNPFANAGGALDLDFDDLVDFSYAITYTQPGTEDFDGDGIPDGDPNSRYITYSELNGPRIDIQPTPPTTFTIQPISAGLEDVFDIYETSGDYFGTYWYGGFTCDRNGNNIFEGDLNNSGTNDYRPFATYFMAMYAGDVAPPICRQDINDDGLLNFFDISTFIALFNAQDPRADFFPVAAGDGLFNFFDLSTFIAEFNAGCPN